MDKIELNEEVLEFPCEFVLKVFGLSNNAFETAVLTIIRKHVPHLKENALKNRHSKDGKYLAMTITFTADSREQLDTIYRALSQDPNVLMAL